MISIGGALLFGVPLGVFGHGHIPADILPWLVILSVFPFVGYGFFTFKDMQFEEFMKVFLMFNFLPQRRVYEDTDMNLYSSLNEEIISEDIIRQRVAAGQFEVENNEWRE